MKDTLVLLKVGGGLISVKQTPHTAKAAVMRSVAREIVSAKAQFAFDMIAATGAGSFGHFTAHEYKLSHGITMPNQLYGAAKTHAEVADLNARFVRALITASLPAIAIAPSAMTIASESKVTKTYFPAIEQSLASHFTPVLHGDGVFDTAKGISIFSGERVLEMCLRHFKKRYRRVLVIYLTNEKGVLDERGAVIAELARDAEVHLAQNVAHDVTGGMAEKVICARRAVDLGADAVYIAGGNQKNILTNILAGAPFKGTRVF